MWISDTSVKRPVFASVLSLLLIAFGIVSFYTLPLREYPDIDAPVVTIDTIYPGAAANVVETRITEILEDRISGVEGIKYISSTSRDGRSSITVEFNVDRDIDAAANDIRDRVSGALDDLPDESDPPDIQKADSSDDVIFWVALSSDKHDVLELTDYARRFLQDRFSVLPGVARVRLGGGLEYSMRIWLDRTKMAARNITANEVVEALRAENVELPAGMIESEERLFTARVKRAYQTPEDFGNLVIDRSEDGYLLRLKDIARVEKSAREDRVMFRGNQETLVGIGIIKQSKANTLEVTRAAKEEIVRLNPTLPEGMELQASYDTSVFIESAINEVYVTFFIAIALVIFVIFLFLGSWRAVLVPAVTVPVSIIATFILLSAFGFSINLLTLLALVLAIGLVVDDAIVVLENIFRRMEAGETPLVAAYRGTRQVGFAVIATTLVLVAVFVPITFLEGDLGRLFSEFAVTMAVAVLFSSLVALTLSPMLASKILKRQEKNKLSQWIDRMFDKTTHGYERVLKRILKIPVIVSVVFIVLMALTGFLYTQIPQEYAPGEDRGIILVIVNGPEGATFSYMEEYMTIIESRLMKFKENGEAQNIIVRAPNTFFGGSFNSGIIIMVLEDWSQRRLSFEILGEVYGMLGDLPGVQAFAIPPQAIGGRAEKAVQFVIGGGTYEQIAQWRDILLQKINENNPGLRDIDYDYKETKPQLRIIINRDRAADLGVSIRAIGTTLETMLGSRQVTTYIDDGEEYDVIIEGERNTQRTPEALKNIYVRSDRSAELIPLSNLVSVEEFADSEVLNRYNRVRSITLEANLDNNLQLGEALDYLNTLVDQHLPDDVIVDYKGESLDYVTSTGSLAFVFVLGLVVVFLVLAAQFESWVHPVVIIITVPLAICGALIGLYLIPFQSLNIYTQIGLIMLVGLATKNGILIVEFINQLRDEGMEFNRAIFEASKIRLRPILMTSITTIVGSIPLLLATGAGAFSRIALGIVIFFGVLAATFFTIFIVPVAYEILARRTGSPGDVARRLESEEQQAGETKI